MTPSPSRHGSSWDTCRACLCCVASGETAEETQTRVAEPLRPSPTPPATKSPTWRLDSWVKAFSQPGWAHLYGRSPVWILEGKD